MDVAAELAVDLDDVEPEVAKMAIGGGAGAKVVEGEGDALRAPTVEEGAHRVRIGCDRAFGDLDDQALGQRRVGWNGGFEDRRPIRVADAERREIDGEPKVGRVGKFCHGKAKRCAVEAPADRGRFHRLDESASGKHLARPANDADQSFVEGGAVGRPGLHDRLERERDAAFFERPRHPVLPDRHRDIADGRGCAAKGANGHRFSRFVLHPGLHVRSDVWDDICRNAAPDSRKVPLKTFAKRSGIGIA